MEKIEDVQRHVLPAHLAILSNDFPSWISFSIDQSIDFFDCNSKKINLLQKKNFPKIIFKNIIN